MQSRATVHRVLTRNGLIDPQAQQQKRKYKRWQRQAPMHLWQLDIVGGLTLADGRECKLLTGIDDHSRFVVLAAVLATPSVREVGEAFIAAMRRYGVPSEVLSHNGGQYTTRFIKPLPVEVLFERICRDNGIKQRLTKPRSPTTTGKIERFQKTLRTEFLDHVAPFESIEAAEDAVDGCSDPHAYPTQHAECPAADLGVSDYAADARTLPAKFGSRRQQGLADASPSRRCTLATSRHLASNRWYCSQEASSTQLRNSLPSSSTAQIAVPVIAIGCWSRSVPRMPLFVPVKTHRDVTRVPSSLRNVSRASTCRSLTFSKNSRIQSLRFSFPEIS